MRLVSVLFLVVVAAALAASAPSGNPVVVKFFNEKQPNGAYKYGYELSDGTGLEETGEVINEGQENQYISVNGYYTYKGTDDVLYRVNYKSGVEGFDPEIDEGPGGAVPPDVAYSLLGG